MVTALDKMTPQESSALSALFSSGVLRELADKGRSARFTRLIGLTRLEELMPNQAASSLKETYDFAFERIARSNLRSAYVYKNLLTQKRFLGRHSLSTASVLSEFRIANAKADFVILNGTSTAYEIKSERDSLARLQGQLAAYLCAFDNVYVVASEIHLDKLAELIPHEVGLVKVNTKLGLTTVREAIPNKTKTVPSVIFDSLTLQEATYAVKELGFAIPQVPNTRIRKELKALFERLEPSSAHDVAVVALRKFRSLLPLRDFLSLIPRSLVAAGISSDLSAGSRNRLLATLDVDLNTAHSWI